MRTFSLLLVLLCGFTSLVSCQESKNSSATRRPDSGNFVQNTYRNDFFGFSFRLPGEWHKSSVAAATLPSGAYYLFIGDRDTQHSPMNRVMVIADAESNYRPDLPAIEYISAIIRAQVTHANADVILKPSAVVFGGTDFYRADYKRVERGMTVYNSLVCTKRNGYFLSWNFVASSERELYDAVNTLQQISFQHRQ